VGAHMSSTIYARVSAVDFTGYHWHYTRGASVGVIPTNDEETLIFASTTPQRFMQELRFDLAAGFRAIVSETAPNVAAAMRAGAVGSYHGFAGRRGFLRPAWGPGWALVGDAGYFKDPLTAHGISDALRDAELLARAVLSGNDAALASYQTIRDDLSVPLFTITDAIASFAWDMPALQALHKSLSDEMAREVLHVSHGGAEGVPFGDVHGGARPAVLRDDHREPTIPFTEPISFFGS
jgi:2-polyprenyl-6-methoxyphenol hydroxylase-like FAD-dependent oxidoreductase